MALFKEVTLKSIGKTRVYLPPNTMIASMLRQKYQGRYPPQPSEQLKVATPRGQPQQYETILTMNGPKFDAWRVECDKIDRERYREGDALNYLFALEDVEVPEDFDAEKLYGKRARYIDPDWKPRDGEFGPKLDYIEWFVLGNSHDQDIVGEALRQLLGLDPEVVEDVVDTFQDNVEG